MEYSFVQLYWRQILVVIVLILLQTAFIILLIFLIIRRRKMQRILERSIKEKEILMKEIHHRVKNNMAIIMSFIDMQSTKAAKGNIDEILKTVKNRIYAMALIHEQIYSQSSLDQIDFTEYFQQLANGILSSYGCANRTDLDLKISNSALPLDHIVNLSIIINEMITNSVKYALKDGSVLKICVNFEYIEDRKMFTLKICDNGPGFPDLENITRDSDSLGIVIIDSLVSQLHGSIKRSNEHGACNFIEFPYIA
jgi:two-component sensor histidine kinase